MHWHKHDPHTYLLNGHTLRKQGKLWTLHTATGLTYPLGASPSFDLAESYLAVEAIVSSTLNAWLFARPYDARVTLVWAASFVISRASDEQQKLGLHALRDLAYDQLSPALKQDADERADERAKR